MKEVWVKFAETADEDYLDLQKNVIEEQKQGKINSFEIQLLKSIDREKDNLKINPHRGIHIPRRNISKALVERYGTDQLWKIDLVGYWRLLYTLAGDEVKIIALVLEFMDHKKYDKLFSYEGK